MLAGLVLAAGSSCEASVGRCCRCSWLRWWVRVCTAAHVDDVMCAACLKGCAVVHVACWECDGVCDAVSGCAHVLLWMEYACICMISPCTCNIVINATITDLC